MSKAKGKKRAGKAADFPKRKSKLGKAKRPPENATKISFKSRSIVLPSQLPQSQQQPTGKRKLGLEALLRHLNHFKPSMRCDGLNGLRELFQDHPHLLIPNLAKLVGPVFGRLIDSDPSVRRSLHTLLSTLFSLVSPHHIHTHFPSITAHISCGLTHINDKIQLDSLKIFQLTLDRYPSLLPPQALHLLPLIVGLLSRYKGGVSGRDTGEKKQVSLAHDPRSKLSKWTSRIDVFNLLSRFLEIILESVDSRDQDVSCAESGNSAVVVDLEWQRVMIEREGEFVQVESHFCNFSSSIPRVMPLQQQGIPYKSVLIPSVSSRALTPLKTFAPQSSMKSESVLSSVSKFIEFSETLLSLIFDCWLECASVQSRGSKDTLVLMETTVHLFCLTLKLSVCVGQHNSTVSLLAQDKAASSLDVLREKYSDRFLKHFMGSFPLHHSSSSSSSSSFTVQTAQYMKINLSLCYVTVLLSEGSDHLYTAALQSVCSYFELLAKLSDTQQLLSSQLMLECSRLISDTLLDLLEVVERGGLPEVCLDAVVSGVDGFYHTCHPQSSSKRCLLLCFRRLLKTFNSNSKVFTKFLLPWLEGLPQLLVDLKQSSPSLSAFLIDTLASVSSYIPLTQLEEHLITLLGSDGALSQLPTLSQRRFVELLWHVPTLSPRLVGVVRQWVWSGSADSSVAAYLIEIIHHRFFRKKGEVVSETDRATQYLIFMLSLLLGDTCIGGDKTAQSDDHERDSALITIVVDEKDVKHRMKIIDIVCECVRSSYFSDQALELTYPTLQSLLEVVIALPVDTALAVLCFLQCITSVGAEIPRPLVPSLARLCFSVLWLSWQPSRPHHSIAERCCHVTKKLISSSIDLLASVLLNFSSEIQKVLSEGDEGRYMAECFLSLLDSTELNCALRECRSVVHTTAASVSEALGPAEESLRARITLSLKKFPLGS